MLPEYRGCACVELTVYLDEQVGNTVHLMPERINEGPIVMKEGLSFSSTDNYPDVRVKVFSAGSRMMAQAVHEIQAKKIDHGQFIP
jgi:methionyl-tRNA formyltransferase